MKLLPIQSVFVGEGRQRREFDEGALQELGDSIRRLGLMHAPVVRFTADNQVVLVAGERRMRAIVDLHELGIPFTYAGVPVPPGQVPVVPLGDLDEVGAWEAELEENVRRQDLTWQERAQADKRLSELRALQAARAGAPPPTIGELAREVFNITDNRPAGELGYYQESVRQNIILAEHLDDPDVKSAASPKEAFKILKKKEEARRHATLAEQVGAVFTSKSHTLLQADSLEWLATASAEQFALILTDPPYGMGADEFGDSGTAGSAASHFYEDSYDSWLEIMRVLPGALFRVAAPEAHAYLFCDIDHFPELRTWMSEAGWRVFRTPLIWNNTSGFRAPWPDAGPQRKYECILFAVKGGRKVRVLRGDVLQYARDTSVGHPAQKPVPLLVDLLSRSALPGDRVLDPFAGSGSTVIACNELQLPCTALELNPAAYGIAVKRVRELSASDAALF